MDLCTRSFIGTIVLESFKKALIEANNITDPSNLQEFNRIIFLADEGESA